MPIEEETSEMPQERQPVPRKERNVSVVSDIDMDELEQALHESQSMPQTSPEVTENQDKRPFIRPLEYEESDTDSEEQPLLSIIQEEDEEDLSESVAFPSNFSQSRSASEGFQSDDDVMDLLDEDHDRDELAAHGVDVGTVQNISQTERTAALSPEDEASGELNLGRYLAKSNKDVKADVSYDSQYRLLDSIELEESESGGVELDGIETTYSDTEADRGGVERSSTPLDQRDEDVDYYSTEREEATHDHVHVEAMPSAGGQALLDQGLEGGMASEEQVRVFIALYDYDPSTMSPNPDAEEEELSFNEGDLIKVGNSSSTGFI